jgi:hypothetical protein
MKMKRTLGIATLAVALLLGLGSVSSEASTVVNLGTLDGAHDQLAYEGQLSSGGTADYRYNFTLGVGSDHTPVTLSAASANVVALDNITIGLFHDDGTSIQSKFYSKATTPGIYTGGSVAGTLLDFSGLLAAGDYYLQLIVGSGKSKEFFNGSIAIAAVPLPGALLLFAAALVPLTVTGLRRRRRDLGTLQLRA